MAVFHRPPDPTVELGIVLEDLDSVDTEGELVGVESDALPAIQVDIAVEGLTTSTDVHVPTPPAVCEVCSMQLFILE